MLRDGSVLVTGEMDGTTTEDRVKLEHRPTSLLARLETWLERYEDGEISEVIYSHTSAASA